MGQGAADTARATRHGLGSAVVAPLKDFGLMKAKIPSALLEASQDPYKMPEGTDCSVLEHEVAKLDLVLGPDVDMPRDAGRPTLAARGSRAASDAALDAVRDLTTGWIPFRGTVRRLTGAADNQDDMEDAVHAGGLRRAYLKGLGLQAGCIHPASPRTLQDAVIAKKKEAETTLVASQQAPTRPERTEIVRTGEATTAASPAQLTPISSSTVALVPGG